MSPGQGVVGGCLPDGGWSSVTAPALILTQTDPYFLGDITECLAGTASAPGATTCTSCEDGVTWAGPGQSSCTPCVNTGCMAGYHQLDACTITSAPTCGPNAACVSLTCPEGKQPKVSASDSLCETATCSARDNAQCCEDRGIISTPPGCDTTCIILIIAGCLFVFAAGFFLVSRMGGSSDENDDDEPAPAPALKRASSAPADNRQTNDQTAQSKADPQKGKSLEESEEQEYEENQTEPENFEED